ncbi:hypothetical protein [Gracilimonas sp.]|uniref:hypothetical protein n=1 Tax=Gracilimonas sp. TaxID=1974203 RepID=UPI00287283BA|nr:hypothetical protein [Gracilimonas sp.]
MFKRVFEKIIFCTVLSLAIWGNVQAQYNVQHQAPVALERSTANTLEFAVPGISQGDIQQARLFYRYDGDFSYQQMEVNYQNGTFRASFDIQNENASVVEYYFEVTLLSGETVYYPNTSPQDNPVEVEIVDTLEDEKPLLEEIDYTILSPTSGNGVTKDDVLIAIALFYDKNNLEPGEFRLYLDEKDITSDADTSAYYIYYIPQNLNTGRHRVALEYEGEDEVYRVVEWNFAVVAPGQETFTGFGPSNAPQISAELAARNQVISGNTNNAYTGRTRISGRYGNWRYSANGYLTSQESDRLQPQNRYGVNVSYGNLFNFEAGHVYPSMSQFTISGRRIHGVNTSLHLLEEKLNLQFIYGELERGVTNLYDSLVVEEVVNSNGQVVDNNYFSPMMRVVAEHFSVR